jgi:hypothetical protein
MRAALLQQLKDLTTTLMFERIRVLEGNRNVPEVYASLNARSENGDRQKSFLTQINDSIRDQVGGLAPPVEIEIPLRVARVPNRVPERVLRGVVDNVQFDDLSKLKGLTIRFHVIHPGSGEVYYGRSCAFVRGVGIDGNPVGSLPWKYTFPPQNSIELKNVLKDVRDNEAKPTYLTFVYPLRTQYAILAEVLNPEQLDPRNPPVVESISVLIVGDERVNLPEPK